MTPDNQNIQGRTLQVRVKRGKNKDHRVKKKQPGKTEVLMTKTEQQMGLKVQKLKSKGLF